MYEVPGFDGIKTAGALQPMLVAMVYEVPGFDGIKTKAEVWVADNHRCTRCPDLTGLKLGKASFPRTIAVYEVPGFDGIKTIILLFKLQLSGVRGARI